MEHEFVWASILDTEFLCELFNSPDFLRNGIRPVSTLSLKDHASGSWLFNFDMGKGFLIYRGVQESERIGAVKIDTNFRNMYSVISGGLVKNKRGSQLGKKLLCDVTKYIFKNYPVERVESNILATNLASINTHLAAGYTKDGIKRGAWFCDGKLQDQYIMSMLRSEFAASTAKHDLIIHRNTENRNINEASSY